jgi:DNA-binding LacI/PurR family transcriptional regulator
MSTPAKPRKPATIKDVAQRAQTSIATVSYVFSNKERYLRPELRERVQRAAAEIGYVKNAAASSIKGKHRGILAVVVAQFGNTFFTRMCVEIVSLARQEGFVVTLCNSDEDPEQERVILERLVAQRIDGCIVSPALSRGENIALLQTHRIPYVILERTLPEPSLPHDFVGHDNFDSGYLATQHLLAAGHRKIAFSGWDSPIPNVRERVDGYRAALREHGLGARDEMVLTDELSEAAGRRMAAKLVGSQATAVVLAHHDTARGALQHFQDVGLRWPEDLSLVMIGTPEWAGVVRPQLTCIQRPEQQMGSAAAALLLAAIKNPEHLPARQLFPCTVLPGSSILRR